MGTTSGNLAESGKIILTSYDHASDIGESVSFSQTSTYEVDITEGTR